MDRREPWRKGKGKGWRKNMEKDVVFIDTSVFKANNYFSSTSKINKLAELTSKGSIGFVLISITKAEIVKHLTRDIENACKDVSMKIVIT